ncbi:hypothetical protein SprV_0501951700 [Sparganum proliferum]
MPTSVDVTELCQALMSVLETRQSSTDTLPLLKPGDNFDVWYSQANVHLASIAAKDRARYICHHLSTEALTKASAFGVKFDTDVDSLLSALRQVFASPKLPMDAYRQFSSHLLLPGESARDYLGCLRSLILAAFPDQPSSLTDVVLAAHFRAGLLDDNLRRKLIKKPNLSSEALLTLLQKYEERYGPSVAAPCYFTSVVRKRQTRSVATQTFRNFTRPFRGRQARVAQISSESYPVPAVTSTSDFPAPIINATVVDRRVAFLVDTGAACSLLNPQGFTRTWLQQTEISHRHPRIVAANGVKTDPAKTEQIRSWPQPTSVTELRGFLGLASYYRRFIKDFAHIATPFNRLTSKQNAFNWSDEYERSFEELKRRLISPPLLAFPNISESAPPFILDTDASDVAIGAVLSQQQTDGLEHPLIFASQTLTKPERNYSTTRKELLAVVTFVKKFHHNLAGKRFILRTDHQALRWWENFKDPTGQLARWQADLLEYSYTVIHRAGKMHQNADALSRRAQTPPPVAAYAPASAITFGTPDHSGWASAQASDPYISLIHDQLRQGAPKPSSEEMKGSSWEARCLWSAWNSLRLCDGVQYSPTDPRRSVLPHDAIHPTLSRLHADLGHAGQARTDTAARQRFWYPNQQRIIQDVCNTCPCFRAYRSATHSSTGHMPSALMYGREVRLPLDTSCPLPLPSSEPPHEFVRNLRANLYRTHELARIYLSTAHQRQKEYYDRRAHGAPYKPGDKVFWFQDRLPPGSADRFSTHWIGSFVVVEVSSEAPCILRASDDPEGPTFAAHFNKLKPYALDDNSCDPVSSELPSFSSAAQPHLPTDPSPVVSVPLLLPLRRSLRPPSPQSSVPVGFSYCGSPSRRWYRHPARRSYP